MQFFLMAISSRDTYHDAHLSFLLHHNRGRLRAAERHLVVSPLSKLS